MVKAIPHFSGEPFFVINSDSIWVEGTTPALPAMQKLWDADRMDGLLLLAEMERRGWEGRVWLGSSEEPYAYPGVQIVQPRLFDGAPEGAFSTNIMWDRAIAARKLRGIVLDGVWIHVGTPDARSEAESYLAALSPA